MQTMLDKIIKFIQDSIITLVVLIVGVCLPIFYILVFLDIHSLYIYAVILTITSCLCLFILKRFYKTICDEAAFLMCGIFIAFWWTFAIIFEQW